MNHTVRSRTLAVFAALVATALLATGLLVSSAQAVSVTKKSIPSTSACEGVASNVGLSNKNKPFSKGKYNDFSTAYPIILVHGMNGKNGRQWGSLDDSQSFAARMNNISGARVAIEFQYNTDPSWYDINFGTHAQDLANAIDCMAGTSKSNGGPGKVIVVAYSEGSALAHGASSKRSRDGKREVADEIGQAITIADARVIYLAPDFPSSVTVHSIGGNIINAVRSLTSGRIDHEESTYTDGLVFTYLATMESSDTAGGGNYIASCYRFYLYHNEYFGYIGAYTSPPCEHGKLLTYKPVQSDTISAIEAFIGRCTGSNPTSNPTGLAALTTDKPSPAPTPTPTGPGTPGTPGVPSGDPTAPTSPPTTPPSGCVG